MSNKKPNPEQALSMISLAWQLFVLAPIWLVLQYMILDALGDTVSGKVWGLYWVYAPACVVGVIVHGVTRTVLAGKK